MVVDVRSPVQASEPRNDSLVRIQFVDVVKLRSQTSSTGSATKCFLRKTCRVNSPLLVRRPVVRRGKLAESETPSLFGDQLFEGENL